MIRLLAVAVGVLVISPAAAADETTHLAVGRAVIWTCSDSGVIEVDARDGSALRHAYVGSDYPLQVAIGGGAAWVAHVGAGYTGGGLTRFDLSTGRATSSLRSRREPVVGVAAGAGRVWALMGPSANARVARIDPGTGRSIGVVRGVEKPTSIDADRSGLWIATAQGWLLHGRRKVVRLPAQRAPLAVALGGRSAWVAGSGAIVRVDEPTDRPAARIRVAGIPVAAAAGRRALWLLVVRRQAWLVRVGARTDRVEGERRVPASTSSVAVGAGGVWLGTSERIPRVLWVDPDSLRLRTFARLL